MIDVRGRKVGLIDGREIGFDKLLLALGAEPMRLNVPGAGEPHVHALRSLDDGRATIHAAAQAKHAVVVGASFIGLEVAAALRTRGVEVHVVAPDRVPMEKVLGVQLGTFVRHLHEEHGVQLHLGERVSGIERRIVQLADGETLAADLLVTGIGVRPRLELARRAGLAVNGGVMVNRLLETSVSGILLLATLRAFPTRFRATASGSSAGWWRSVRGQTAAPNTVGPAQPLVEPPFFWSQHYDVAINYVGHAERSTASRWPATSRRAIA